MARGSEHLFQYLAIIPLLFIVQVSQAHLRSENGVKTDIFLSPQFVLEPGSVSNKIYYNIDFPRGHIAIKSFNAEVIDDKGNPIPLHETYLHHWVVMRYHQRKGVGSPKKSGDFIIVKNSGLCEHGLVQYFGLGSETRRTPTDVPDPYGIEVGNLADIPPRCDLYNVTVDEFDRVLPRDYIGGLKCCYDEARCRVKNGFGGVKRNLFLRYTIQYVEWDASFMPVKIYIFDVTDLWRKEDETRGLRARHRCLIEYDVNSCPVGMATDDCVHTKTISASLLTGGDVIYGVGHQHTGGVGITLYGEGGREICSSIPTYGTGHEPGNEAGYIMGMSTCYPAPGSVKISAGETLTLVSNYSSAQGHTGVMGLFYILVADSSANPKVYTRNPSEADKSIMISDLGWPIALFGVGLFVVASFMLYSKSRRGEGYEALTA